MSDVRISAAPFDPEEMLSAMRRGNPKVGAIVNFVGLMRDINDGDKSPASFSSTTPA